MALEKRTDALAKPTPETVQVADVQNVRVLAKDLLDSGMFPAVKSVAGAITVIQAGLELGIPPVAALNTMVIINGRLAMEAKLLLAVAQRRVHLKWRVTKEGPEGCWITFTRPGWPDTESSFTRKEAEAAGLLGKTNWKLWEKDMYFARASGRGVRRIAPDAVLGLYAKEEMEDSPANLNGGASTAPESEALKTIAAATEELKSAEVHSPAPVADEFSFSSDAQESPEAVAGLATDDEKLGVKNGIEELKRLGKTEEMVWVGVVGEVKKVHDIMFTDTADMTSEVAKTIIDYLGRWAAHIKNPPAKKGKANG